MNEQPTNTQHTPGPLEVDAAQDVDSGTQTFAIVQRRKWQDLSIALVNADEMCGAEEARANAFLYAAAPDMLATLIEAVTAARRVWMVDANLAKAAYGTFYERAQNAIAKATAQGKS